MAPKISNDFEKGRLLSSPVEIFQPNNSMTSSAVLHAEPDNNPSSNWQKPSKKFVTTSLNSLASIVRCARAARLNAQTELTAPNGKATASKSKRPHHWGSAPPKLMPRSHRDGAPTACRLGEGPSICLGGPHSQLPTMLLSFSHN